MSFSHCTMTWVVTFHVCDFVCVVHFFSSWYHELVCYCSIPDYVVCVCVCVFSLPHSAIMIVTFPDPTVCHFICLFFNFSSLRYHELVCDCRIS